MSCEVAYRGRVVAVRRGVQSVSLAPVEARDPWPNRAPPGLRASDVADQNVHSHSRGALLGGGDACSSPILDKVTRSRAGCQRLQRGEPGWSRRESGVLAAFANAFRTPTCERRSSSPRHPGRLPTRLDHPGAERQCLPGGLLRQQATPGASQGLYSLINSSRWRAAAPGCVRTRHHAVTSPQHHPSAADRRDPALEA